MATLLLFNRNKIFQITFMQQFFPTKQLSEDVVLSFDCVWPYLKLSVWFYLSFTPTFWRTKENSRRTKRNIYTSISVSNVTGTSRPRWLCCVGRVTEPVFALLLPSPNSSMPGHLLFTWWTTAGLSIWQHAQRTQKMIIMHSPLAHLTAWL